MTHKKKSNCYSFFFMAIAMAFYPAVGLLAQVNEKYDGWWEGSFQIAKMKKDRADKNEYAYKSGSIKYYFEPVKNNTINGKMYAAAFEAATGKLKIVRASFKLKAGEPGKAMTLKSTDFKKDASSDETMAAVILGETIAYQIDEVDGQFQFLMRFNHSPSMLTGISWMDKTDNDKTVFNEAYKCVKKGALKDMLKQGSQDEQQAALVKKNQGCALDAVLKGPVQYSATGDIYNTTLIRFAGLLPLQIMLSTSEQEWLKEHSVLFGLEESEIYYWKELEEMFLHKGNIVMQDKKTGERKYVTYPQVDQLSIVAVGNVSSGKAIVKEIDYGDINDFREGYAVVRKGEKYGMIDAAGKEFMPLGKYDFVIGLPLTNHVNVVNNGVCDFYNGMCIVKDPETKKYGYIDSTGKLVIPTLFSSALPFMEDGYGIASVTDPQSHKPLMFFFDKKGRKYPTKTVGDGNPFFTMKGSSDLVTTIFTRKNGTKAFETKYRIFKYSEGVYYVGPPLSEDNTKKYGLMDTTGKLIVPFRFQGNGYLEFKEGLALYEPEFKDEYQYSYLNKKGEEVILLKKMGNIIGYESPRQFESGYADITVKVKGQYNKEQMIDKTGKIFDFEDLFRKANPQISNDLSPYGGSSDYKFKYLRRNKAGIVFGLNAALKPKSVSAKLFYYGQIRSLRGGIGSSNSTPDLDFWEVNASGMMDYDGNIIISPVFSKIGNFDPVSGLAKATGISADGTRTIQGFINNKGEFVLTMKNPTNSFQQNF